MENQEQAQPTADTSTTDSAAVAQPELGIADLQNLRAILDVAVRRGAFAATEITAVGTAYDRLNVFLNAVAPKVDSAEPSTTE